MKFLTVRELRGSSARVWKTLAAERELVVTNNGRPVAILSAVGESDVEESLNAIRRAKAVSAVTRLQARSVAQGFDTLDQKAIDAEIAAVRRRAP